MRVVTAKDGLDAISVMQEGKPDIILLDIEMPRMDGYEFASHVRNDDRVADVPLDDGALQLGSSGQRSGREARDDRLTGVTGRSPTCCEELGWCVRRRTESLPNHAFVSHRSRSLRPRA